MHLVAADLEAGLDEVRRAPADGGRVELIVCRPAIGERRLLERGVLDDVEGLVGDTWRTRGSNGTPEGSAHPGRQITIMNMRAAVLMAGQADRAPLAGDQLFVDLDLSETNLPAGARLSLGAAVLEVTEQPHLGCRKFAERFGEDALRFVNSPVGRQLRVRGLNAKVVVPGAVAVGDAVWQFPRLAAAP